MHMINPCSSWNLRGSEWNRWDPHLHAPGTLLNDQFKGDWEAYLRRIEDAIPTVRALGVTDYVSIETYRVVQQRKADGRMPQVGLIFPNVEMRLDIQTEKKKAVNLHLLFSPDDRNHEAEIERILSFLTFPFRGKTYQCTTRGLIELGREFDNSQTNDIGALRVGANQFKVAFAQLRDVYVREEWLRRNCVVAVSGGLRDGTAGLQDDQSYTAMRRELESFAQIIFASTPGQREFWLGKRAGADHSYIEKTYGAIKPCLHGSDAHDEESTAAPDLDRFCWIKGDLDFESLRQAILEPEERVWIGHTPAESVISSDRIRTVRVSGAPWLKSGDVELNSGMVAVIGPRGSGKTALADIIASGAGAVGVDLGDSSFLKRAAKHLTNATVELIWGDNSTLTASVLPELSDDPFQQPAQDVCYLSQHFVDRLCSSTGVAKDLRAEMERVVFDRTVSTERLEANSFEEYVGILLEPIQHRREELILNIQAATRSIVEEELLRDAKPRLVKEQELLRVQISKDQVEQRKLVPKGKEARAKRLGELEQACNEGDARIEALKRRRKQFDDLDQEVERIRTYSEPARLAQMQQRFLNLTLSHSDWAAFGMDFSGDVDQLLAAAMKATDKAVSIASDGNPDAPVDRSRTPLANWPLIILKEERDKVKKEVGIDAEKQKKYEQLQRTVIQKEAARRRLQTEIKRAEGADGRRREHIQSRRNAYKSVFATLVKQQQILETLYAPLKTELAAAQGALTKLQFQVARTIDLDAWVVKGEKLFDLRKASAFQGRGSLKNKAEKHLLAAWASGTADEVAIAMDGFREEFHTEFKQGMPNSAAEEGKEYREWVQSIASWLYDLSHVRIQYRIQYDGVSVEQLSPGTRGIVLLLLYLALDTQDRRPLIIDQPEENLDPKSVFDELVPHFRAARKRRQVIIVTHNANLVVNTDVDQVIVATSIQVADGGLPSISYASGSLENPEIRRAVCEILEGGERAFIQRARRYRLYWK